jgi:acyl-CoA thioesterase YciA
MSDSGERHLALKALMMPRDTNQHGTIFGGVLLSCIDQAGAIGAQAHATRSGWSSHPLVTVAMNSVEFREPVYVGDVLSFWTQFVRVGRTSITMRVLVETDRGHGPQMLTQAEVTYVAISSDGSARMPVPIRSEQQDH